jgi:hypothetical protein
VRSLSKYENQVRSLSKYELDLRGCSAFSANPLYIITSLLQGPMVMEFLDVCVVHLRNEIEFLPYGNLVDIQLIDSGAWTLPLTLSKKTRPAGISYPRAWYVRRGLLTCRPRKSPKLIRPVHREP